MRSSPDYPSVEEAKVRKVGMGKTFTISNLQKENN